MKFAIFGLSASVDIMAAPWCMGRGAPRCCPRDLQDHKKDKISTATTYSSAAYKGLSCCCLELAITHPLIHIPSIKLTVLSVCVLLSRWRFFKFRMHLYEIRLGQDTYTRDR